jgi:hypothetical protein
MTRATVLPAKQLLVIDPPLKSTSQTGPEKIRTRLDIEPDLGSFSLESVINSDFSIHHLNANFNYPVIVKPTSTPETKVGLSLISAGKSQARFGQRMIDVTGGMSLFTYNPAIPEEHYFKEGYKSTVTYIEMSQDYF